MSKFSIIFIICTTFFYSTTPQTINENVVITSSSTPTPSTSDAGTRDDAISETGQLFQAFLNLEPVQRKIQAIISVVDLKIRIIRFLRLVLTRENFLLVRRLNDMVIGLAEFINGFIPPPNDEDEAAGNGGLLIGTLFPGLGSGNVDQDYSEIDFRKEYNKRDTKNSDNNDYEKYKKDIMLLDRLIGAA